MHQARELLNFVDPDSHPKYIAGLLEGEGDPGFSREEAWMEAMEELIGLKKADRGDTNREQLIIGDQQMYSCPRCEDMAL